MCVCALMSNGRFYSAINSFIFYKYLFLFAVAVVDVCVCVCMSLSVCMCVHMCARAYMFVCARMVYTCGLMLACIHSTARARQK